MHEDVKRSVRGKSKTEKGSKKWLTMKSGKNRTKGAGEDN